jgi:hypothetical protein
VSTPATHGRRSQRRELCVKPLGGSERPQRLVTLGVGT